MPVVGAKPAPPLHGALQWTGSNAAEFVAFGGSGATVTPSVGGAIEFSTSRGFAIVQVNSWVITALPGRGEFPTQLNGTGGTLLVLSDEEFQDQFTTIEDWSRTY